MNKLYIVLLLFVSNCILAQEKIVNEKEIKNSQQFSIEEMKVKIDETTTLFGSLITPKTEFDTILIIIAGTGKISQKAHNYLTEFLLENNIGVFRFDKRGIGKSTGTYNDQLKVYSADFSKVFKEFKKLETVAHKRIGILGHSLGGLVAINSIKNTITPDFLIQWATPLGKPRTILNYQIKNGIKNYDQLIIGKTTKERIAALDFAHELIDQYPDKDAWNLWKIGKKTAKKRNIKKKAFSNYIMPHRVDFARIDNTETYQNIDFPTLVVIGSKDILVDPNENKTVLQAINNPNITFKEIANLNHFMTPKGTNQKTNDIYNIDTSFKEYLVTWINSIKN